jgi:hypothetical protein
VEVVAPWVEDPSDKVVADASEPDPVGVAERDRIAIPAANAGKSGGVLLRFKLLFLVIQE